MPFSTSAIFFCLFHLFHISNTLPFEGFFHWENTNKVAWGETGWIGRVGDEGYANFWPKTAEHSMIWAGALINNPSWNGQTCWKSLQKSSLKPKAASYNSSWYTDRDSFLEHSPSRGKHILQRTCPPEDNSVFGGSPILRNTGSCDVRW